MLLRPTQKYYVKVHTKYFLYANKGMFCSRISSSTSVLKPGTGMPMGGTKLRQNYFLGICLALQNNIMCIVGAIHLSIWYLNLFTPLSMIHISLVLDSITVLLQLEVLNVVDDVLRCLSVYFFNSFSVFKY